MPTNDRAPGLTRRQLLGGIAAVGFFAALGRPARAAGTEAATAFVTALTQQLLALVNSGKSEGQVYAGFEAILARYADMPAVAASVLGPPWRGASQAQKQAFVAAFQHYLSRRYGKQFRDYKNARFQVTGARDGGKAGVLVSTRVVRPGQEDIAVDYQVSDRSGQIRVVNLIIEGVSMLATERAEIGAIVEAQRGNLDAVTAQLAKTA
jgi:phospholipid transport system substrate-binding protein